MPQFPNKWRDLRLAVIDVETTGLDPQDDRIIEIGIVTFENAEVDEVYGQLVDPEQPVPDDVTDLTGIAESDLEGKPTFDEIADDVHDRLTGVGICAYNLDFDKDFVEAELDRAGYHWPEDSPTFDPLVFARQFFKDQRRKNLGTIADLLDIPLEEAHRATHDAKVAGHILYAFADRLPEELEDLMVLQAQWEQEQARDRASWRGEEEASETLSAALSDNVGLGPAYVYGDEPDPLRALYRSVPEATDE